MTLPAPLFSAFQSDCVISGVLFNVGYNKVKCKYQDNRQTLHNGLHEYFKNDIITKMSLMTWLLTTDTVCIIVRVLITVWAKKSLYMYNSLYMAHVGDAILSFVFLLFIYFRFYSLCTLM